MRIRVVSAPLGRPATVLTDSGQIVHGYLAPGPDARWWKLGETDFVFEGEEVLHEVYSKSGQLLFDKFGRQQLGQKAGGGVELQGLSDGMVDKITHVSLCRGCGEVLPPEELDQDGDCARCAAGARPEDVLAHRKFPGKSDKFPPQVRRVSALPEDVQPRGFPRMTKREKK